MPFDFREVHDTLTVSLPCMPPPIPRIARTSLMQSLPMSTTEGMIVTQGSRFGGYGLILSKGEFGFGRGKVVFPYNLLDLKRTAWEGPELRAGKHTIVLQGRLVPAWARAARACST